MAIGGENGESTIICHLEAIMVPGIQPFLAIFLEFFMDTIGSSMKSTL
jgi:hypothetical protein